MARRERADRRRAGRATAAALTRRRTSTSCSAASGGVDVAASTASRDGRSGSRDDRLYTLLELPEARDALLELALHARRRGLRLHVRLARGSVSGSAGASSAPLLVPLAQVARQLGRRARRPRECRSSSIVVGALLELLDVGGGLLVGGDRLADLLGVRAPRPRSSSVVSISAPSRSAEPRRRARARRAGSARARRSAAPPPRGWPTAAPRRRQASWSTPTIPVGPSYREADSPSCSISVRVARAARHRRRPRVRDVGEQRAERDDELDAELLREARRRARRSVRQRRFGSIPSSSTASRSAPSSGAWKKRVSGQSICACRALDERDVRPRRLEVEEPLGVDVGEPRRRPSASRGSPPPATRPGRRRSSRGTRRRAPDRSSYGPLVRLAARLASVQCTRGQARSQGAGAGAASPAPRRRPRRRPRAPTCTSTTPHGSRCATGSRRPPSARAGARARPSADAPEARRAPRRLAPEADEECRNSEPKTAVARTCSAHGSTRLPSRRMSSPPECGPAAVASVPDDDEAEAGRRNEQAGGAHAPGKRARRQRTELEAPGVERDDHAAREHDEREQEVRHDEQRVEIEDDGDAAERRLAPPCRRRSPPRSGVAHRGSAGVRARGDPRERGESVIGKRATARFPNSTNAWRSSPGRTLPPGSRGHDSQPRPDAVSRTVAPLTTISVERRPRSRSRACRNRAGDNSKRRSRARSKRLHRGELSRWRGPQRIGEPSGEHDARSRLDRADAGEEEAARGELRRERDGARRRGQRDSRPPAVCGS